MKRIAKFRKQQMLALTAAIMATAWMPSVMAADQQELPTGQHDCVGVKNISRDGNDMSIELEAKRAAINWESFNIAKDHSVTFSKPNDTGWAVLNRVTTIDKDNISKIEGSLIANGGTVFLINPNGITFGEGAQVDVGSLVASTRDIINSNFNKGTYEFNGNTEKPITVSNLANIRAENGMVTLIAHDINNYGNISAKQVELIAGDKVTLKNVDKVVDYDNKIGVVVNTLSSGGQVINNGNIQAVVMQEKDANALVANLIKSDASSASQIIKDEFGNIELIGDKVLVDGNITTDGTVTTIGKNLLQVNDKASIDAETWNATGKIVDVVAGVTGDKATVNKISSTSVSKALANTDVNITACPTNPSYYADINVKDAITKDSGNDTTLTFTAGRNISVDADITSTTGKAGKLNITLNSNNKLDGKSERDDGASIIKANIATNGGNFTTTGTIGTYFGLKADSETSGITRSVTTNGGNIRLEGEQVLLATGREVKLDAGTGSVFIAGKVDSANVYHNESSTKKFVSWYEVNALYEKENSTTDKVGDSHLAVITSHLEDAVVSSTIPKKSNASTEAYVGGHVVAVPVDDSGAPLGCTVGTDGKIKLSDDLANGKLENVTILKSADPTNVKIGNVSRGWYKLNGTNTDGSNTYVRFWAWTTGPEKGKIFYVQAAKVSADNKILKKMDIKNGYANFAPNEPNDDNFHGAEPALAVNYDTYVSDKYGEVLYSQWDDIFENATDRGVNNMQNYVVETQLANTALNINAGETTLGGDIGSDTKLSNLTALSSANINVNGSIQVDKKVNLNANSNNTVKKFIEAGSTVDVKTANGSVSTQAITAGDKIKLTAGKDVSIGGKITSHKVVSQPEVLRTSLLRSSAVPNDKADIIISAQGNFNNNVAEEDSANALTTDAGRYWKVYAEDPANSNMGELNSNAFAVWGWDGKSSETGIDSNLYIFKYNPTLTFTADNATKNYGESISNTGFTYDNEMDGKYLNNILDGYNIEFMNRPGMKSANTTSAGYPANAHVGKYAIYMSNADAATAWGYKIVMNPGVLTVTGTEPNPGDVKPQLDPHATTNVDGSASYTTAPRTAPGTDRVLGLQSAELPFFREELHQVKFYGTYDVSIDPDKVKMEPSAKVLPEPDQPQNQYREYDKELTTQAGTAKFKLTYNGSTFDIYPTDNASKSILLAGEVTKNVEVESQALFAAFKEMGITLDDLNGVYIHFDNKSEVTSLLK